MVGSSQRLVVIVLAQNCSRGGGLFRCILMCIAYDDMAAFDVDLTRHFAGG